MACPGTFRGCPPHRRVLGMSAPPVRRTGLGMYATLPSACRSGFPVYCQSMLLPQHIDRAQPRPCKEGPIRERYCCWRGWVPVRTSGNGVERNTPTRGTKAHCTAKTGFRPCCWQGFPIQFRGSGHRTVWSEPAPPGTSVAPFALPGPSDRTSQSDPRGGGAVRAPFAESPPLGYGLKNGCPPEHKTASKKPQNEQKRGPCVSSAAGLLWVSPRKPGLPPAC